MFQLDPGIRRLGGRLLLAGVALVAVAGVGYRLVSTRNTPVDDTPASEAPRVAVRPTPMTPRASDVAAAARPAPPIPQPPPPPPAPADKQAEALRETVVRDIVRTIRLAAIRGDDASVDGLVPGLLHQKALSRTVVGEALGKETDVSARSALQRVMGKLNG